MECSKCPYLMKREKISIMSRMIGYTAECSKNAILFRLEDYPGVPYWCPLKESKTDAWHFDT